MEPTDLSLLAPMGAESGMATFDCNLYGDTQTPFDPSRGTNTRTSAAPLGGNTDTSLDAFLQEREADMEKYKQNKTTPF
jgi:hypothetical protein